LPVRLAISPFQMLTIWAGESNSTVQPSSADCPAATFTLPTNPLPQLSVTENCAEAGAGDAAATVRSTTCPVVVMAFGVAACSSSSASWVRRWAPHNSAVSGVTPAGALGASDSTPIRPATVRGAEAVADGAATLLVVVAVGSGTMVAIVTVAAPWSVAPVAFPVTAAGLVSDPPVPTRSGLAEPATAR
jgi:hypothetical protein